MLAGKTVTDISAGRYSTCAVADGAAYCWGANGTQGMLGTGDLLERLVPATVSTSGSLAGKPVTAISVGQQGHTCVVAGGGAYCWGDNSFSNLGTGTGGNSLVPVAVNTAGVLGGKVVTAISSSQVGSCAVANEAGYCWGANSGQFGNGTTNYSSVPVVVTMSGALVGKSLTSISTSSSHTCGVANGALYCWGANSYGQLGTGNTTNTTLPVAVMGALSGKSLSSVSAGLFYTCATADGEAYCWGQGSNKLGTGDTVQQNSPVKVAGGVLSGKTVLGVAAGQTHTVAFYE